MNRKKKKVFFVSLTILLVSSITTFAVMFYSSLDGVKNVKITKNNLALGIKQKSLEPLTASSTDAGIETSTELSIYDKDITNIALFGVDTRTGFHEAKHSDSIMILTIDNKHKKLKLSSFMRDLYVGIDGHGNNKLNAAYAYGGPELAIKTLNENFNLDIKDYVTANFSGLADIIDEVGGIRINVKEKELAQVNKYMREAAKLKGEKQTPVLHGGYQLLNGNQAQAYARIRKVGNGDFERTERQKTVLLTLFEKIKSKNILSYPRIANKLLSCLETSLDKPRMLEIGTNLIGYGASNIDWSRFPVDGYVKSERINHIFYLTADLKTTSAQVRSFLYDDVKTPPLGKKLASKTNLQTTDTN